MFSYVVSQFVILFVLESLQITWTVLMISRFASITRTVPMILQQMLDNRCIIEKTVNVGADAMVCLQYSLIGIADTLMNLVAFSVVFLDFS